VLDFNPAKKIRNLWLWASGLQIRMSERNQKSLALSIQITNLDERMRGVIFKIRAIVTINQ